MKLIIYIIPSLIFLASCTPKVYVIDRQTVIQTEASGEFPRMKQRLEKQSLNYGPDMKDRSELNDKNIQSSAFRILNGEMIEE